MKPSANVLIPYFEIRLPDPNAASLVDTALGLVNAKGEETVVEYTIYTNWGIPVLQFTDTLRPTEPRAIDLENWIVSGELPDRTLGEAELAELHAALSGRPSPTDHLYRGTAVEPTLAVGYLIMRALGDPRSVLWGDIYSLDPMTDYFQGETLAVLDDNLEAECSRHAIRFVNRDDLYDGTEFIIWTGRRFEPSPTPEPVGDKVQLIAEIYDEDGNYVGTCVREFIATQTIEAGQLDNLPQAGWIDMNFEMKTQVAQHLHRTTAASAQLHAWCLPVDLDLRGDAGIGLEKYVNQLDADHAPGALVEIGSEVSFEYHVKNTGSLPLVNIEVTDSEGLLVTCPKTTLQPGEIMVCTATAPAEPCSHKNIGTVVGYTEAGRPVKARDPGWYTAGYDASIALEKRVNGEDADHAPGLELAEGADVKFTFEVTNTGSATLTSIEVTDDEGIAITCPADHLEPGQSMTCSAAVLPATTGAHVNHATVRANDPCGERVTATDPAHYHVPDTSRPAIDVEKYVNGDDADAPTGPIVDIKSDVQFRYVITNTGNVPLSDVEMEDPEFHTCTSATLAAGASFECTATADALAGQHENVAKVHGHWGDSVVSDEDLGHYFGRAAETPAIDVEKYVNGKDADTTSEAVHVLIGSTVNFTFVVTNVGDVILNGVAVSDDTGLVVGCPKSALVPGESMTCTATATAAQGLHTNIATATGTAGSGSEATEVTDTDPANYFGDPETHPDIDIEKYVNRADADTAAQAVHVEVGSTLQFTYVVTNTGDVKLNGITVTDDTKLVVTCPKTALDPAESMTCTATATAVLGLHTNVGTVSGTPVSGPSTPVTDSDPANYVGEPAGSQGCSPGYWKNHTGAWPPAGYSPSQSVDSVFTSVNPDFPTLGDATLLEALSFGGGSGTSGGAQILLRAAVAALLNAAHPGVSYPLSVAEVIAGVNAALASNDRNTMLNEAAALDASNNLGCPLSNVVGISLTHF